MHQNNDLYHHLLNKAKQLTDNWYNSIDKSSATGVYASTDETVIARLKAQNYSFHEHLIQVFVEEDESFFPSFEKWVNEIESNPSYVLNLQMHILQEFLNVQGQYVSMITSFAKDNEDKYSNTEVNLWISIVLKAFGKIMTRFVEVHDMLATKRLKSQQALINELSAPVIQLQGHTGLLPVVGEVDTQRAKYLLENTLSECTNKGITHLFIDLSGVNIIDTMVAMQIFQLIDALKIVGVKTTLSGVRPEIALTAVNLGLDFKDIKIAGNLSQALQKK